MFAQYIDDIKASLDQLSPHQLQATVDVILHAWHNDRQIFIMGNGGSAATASHLACDLSKNTVNPTSPRLRVLSVNDNMALFSAYSNDNGYENVFVEQLKNLLNAGDVVIAISASGNSLNVLKAVRFANKMGAYTVGWSGYEGGELAKTVQQSLVIPNHNIEQIEDIHLMLGHMVTVAVRNAMVANEVGAPALLPFAEALETATYLH